MKVNWDLKDKEKLYHEWMVRLSHEVAQLELRFREKENDFRMIILKIKELKWTF